jgi:hypothetical protein
MTGVRSMTVSERWPAAAESPGRVTGATTASWAVFRHDTDGIAHSLKLRIGKVSFLLRRPVSGGLQTMS